MSLQDLTAFRRGFRVWVLGCRVSFKLFFRAPETVLRIPLQSLFWLSSLEAYGYGCRVRVAGIQIFVKGDIPQKPALKQDSLKAVSSGIDV